MSVNAEDYRLAAGERYNAAVNALKVGDYATAHYLAGVAVECMLRAYLRRKTPVFESKHELGDLARKSGFLSLVPQSKLGPTGVFNEMNLRWRSNHRYYTDKKLRKHLYDSGMTLLRWYDPTARQGALINDDVLKPNARRMIDLASNVLAWGDKQWK